MGYREVTMLEIKEVLRLWCGGAPKKRIAAQLGLDIKTVRRYLRAAQACGVRPGGEPPSEELRAAVVADLWGRHRPLRAWIFTPVVSRYRFVYPCFPETTPSGIEACAGLCCSLAW